VALSDIDLLDLDRFARDGFPHHWFAELRAEAPVWRHPQPDGPGFWVVSGHADVVDLGRCPHILSSDSDHGGVSGLGPGDALWEQTTGGIGDTGFGDEAKMLLTLDPPEHTQYRKIVNRAFTPSRIGALEPMVRGRVVGLLDGLDDGVVDVTTELAMPLPMGVIADMIGAPPEDHHQIMRWGNEAVTGTDPEYEPGPGGQLGALLSMLQYFGGLREAKASSTSDDLCSVLIHAEVDGHHLSPVRFTLFLFLLAAAGNETTRNAISHGVAAFADHPDEWQRLREDRSLIGPAVEEVLRWASPVTYFRRTAVAPMEVGGQAIEVGDVVSLWYPSANRDGSAFTEPDRFDVGRTPNDHVTFGGGGPHFCLGASLARLELRVLLEELLDRYERFEAAGPVDHLRSNFLNGIKHLPMRLHP
jgi:cholest-4-en-3-one 26-monooxygenase